MTTSKAGASPDSDQADISNKGLYFLSNLGSFFRKKYKSVRDLNDAEFLSLFDIPSVNCRIDSRFNIKSTAALVQHFHSRTREDWLQPPSWLNDLAFNTDNATDDELLARADQVLDLDLEWSGVPPELNQLGEIDWQKNILQNREWLYRINRHSWWPLLGHAYARSGDERYAKAFAQQFTAWVSDNDVTDATEDTPHIWSNKQIALRLRVSWIPSFGMFYESPYFNTSRKLMMLRSIFDQARVLKKSTGSDSLLLNGGLVSAGITFPELREAEHWRDTAINRCRDYLRVDSSPENEGSDLRWSNNLLAFSDMELASDAC
jgi:hypothetical protein